MFRYRGFLRRLCEHPWAFPDAVVRTSALKEQTAFFPQVSWCFMTVLMRRSPSRCSSRQAKVVTVVSQAVLTAATTIEFVVLPSPPSEQTLGAAELSSQLQNALSALYDYVIDRAPWLLHGQKNISIQHSSFNSTFEGKGLTAQETEKRSMKGSLDVLRQPTFSERQNSGWFG